jgi:hypothetical protein
MAAKSPLLIKVGFDKVAGSDEDSQYRYELAEAKQNSLG